MKDSNNHSEDLIFINHELCSQKECANCFELGGCIYEQHLVSTIPPFAEPKAENQLKDIAPVPKRA